MQAGLEELERWLHDLARQGLAQARQRLDSGLHILVAENHAAHLELQVVAQQEAAKARWLEGVAEATTALAHEVNNPLTTLIMNAELLEESGSKDVADVTAEIQSAARRIAAVVKRLVKVGNHRSIAYVGKRRMLDLSPEEES